VAGKILRVSTALAVVVVLAPAAIFGAIIGLHYFIRRQDRLDREDRG
jgi:lipid-A-disaccharide synthase-like uncharacterized protein